ncbi:MAG TPA: ORF6N domain-containing protein [Candidatus Paceibacterota bacterium]
MINEKENKSVIKIPSEVIEKQILIIRSKKVMLDSDLAKLYKVTTGNLNLAVNRNISRFPEDFMFQITEEENNSLILQFARSKIGRGGRRHSPYVFTELGVGMLSSVLNSDRAVQMNIFIIRAFAKLREMLATHKDLAIKIEEIERKQEKQGKDLITVYSLIKKFLDEPVKPNKRIGFNEK